MRFGPIQSRKLEGCLHAPVLLLVVVWLCGAHFAVFADTHAASNLTSLAPKTNFSASAECPCLSKEEVAARVNAAMQGSPEANFCGDGFLPRAGSSGGTLKYQCYPDDFGSESCRAWGLITDEVCLSHPPGFSYAPSDLFEEANVDKWCNYGWCYVDNDNCYSPRTKSVFFPKADLYYSYGTCGYANTKLESLFMSSVKYMRTNLRISYPGNDAYRLWRPDAEGKVEVGSFPALWGELTSQLLRLSPAFSKLSAEKIPISEDAKKFVEYEYGYSSSYTACAVMIALNQTDICMGPFWSLRERHMLASYMQPWEIDGIYMLSFKKRLDALDILDDVFQPFTGWVWLLFLLTSALMVVLFAWVEIGPRMAAMNALQQGVEVGSSTCFPGTVKQKIRSICETILMSTEVVLETHPLGYNALSNPGKILKVAFGAFLAFFMATYTANLAAILGSQSDTEFSSLSDFTEAGNAKICVPSVLTEQLVALKPEIKNRAVPVDFEQVMDAMDQGVCKAALTYDALDAVKPIKHCDKRRVGDLVMSFPVSVLTQPVLARQLTLISEDRITPSIREDRKRQAIKLYNPSVNGFQGCQDVAFDEDSDKLGVDKMAGLFVLFGMVALVAVLSHIFEWLKLCRTVGAIPFECKAQGDNHCYIQDPCKDMYVLRPPPGLHYGKEEDVIATITPRASKRDLASSFSSVPMKTNSIFKQESPMSQPADPSKLEIALDDVISSVQSSSRKTRASRSWGR